MHSLSQTFSDINKILSKGHMPFERRLATVFAYVFIRIKRFFRRFDKLKIFDYSRQHLAGFTIFFGDFEDFFWSFRDVFVDEDYYFKTKSNTPRIIDAGANIGLSVLYFKLIYPKSTITAFEPHPDNLHWLKMNVEKNSLKDVEIIEAALSDRKGQITLYGNRRAATIHEGYFGRKGRWNRDLVENENIVQTVTLAQYIDDKPVDFLKLDIEGAEGVVVSSLNESNKLGLIKRITMEYHYGASEENFLSDIIRNLEKNNFKLAFFNSSNRVDKVTERNYTHLMLIAVIK